MNINRIYKLAAVAAVSAAMAACNEKEADLLEAKVYFESSETVVEVDTEIALSLDLRARLSSACPVDVTVSYEIAGPEEVERYNKINGTDYIAFDAANASLSESEVTISGNAIYAGNVSLSLTSMDEVKVGKPYVLPVRIKSASVPVIESEGVVYYIINKPVKITKAFNFYSNYVYVPLPVDKEYTSVTYEALINVSRFGDNNTVMGHEGVLIFRIGDEGGGLDRHLLQIAGSKQYNYAEKLTEGKWYHVAFTYDQPSGSTSIYVNGVKAIAQTWDTPSFRLGGAMAGGAGFYIGQVYGFMWGTRPFYGNICEVRLWTKARTEKEINQNMLNVDPASEGLEFYYKMDGTDQVQNDQGQWVVKDASGNGMDGLVNGGSRAMTVTTLDKPVSVK